DRSGGGTRSCSSGSGCDLLAQPGIEYGGCGRRGALAIVPAFDGSHPLGVLTSVVFVAGALVGRIASSDHLRIASPGCSRSPRSRSCSFCWTTPPTPGVRSF